MTYSEKLKELYLVSNQKLKACTVYAAELKKVVAGGKTSSVKQINDQNLIIEEYQAAITDYSNLLAFINKNRVRFDDEYVLRSGKHF